MKTKLGIGLMMGALLVQVPACLLVTGCSDDWTEATPVPSAQPPPGGGNGGGNGGGGNGGSSTVRYYHADDIRITVRDSSGNPVVNEPVFLRIDGTPYGAFAYTDSTGYASLDDVNSYFSNPVGAPGETHTATYEFPVGFHPGLGKKTVQVTLFEGDQNQDLYVSITI